MLVINSQKEITLPVVGSKMSLGDYEKEVLISLDQQLTTDEARPLNVGYMSHVLFNTILSYYCSGLHTYECVAAIHKIRLMLFPDVEGLDALAIKLLSPSGTGNSTTFEATPQPMRQWGHDGSLQGKLNLEG